MYVCMDGWTHVFSPVEGSLKLRCEAKERRERGVAGGTGAVPCSTLHCEVSPPPKRKAPAARGFYAPSLFRFLSDGRQSALVPATRRPLPRKVKRKARRSGGRAGLSLAVTGTAAHAEPELMQSGRHQPGRPRSGPFPAPPTPCLCRAKPEPRRGRMGHPARCSGSDGDTRQDCRSLGIPP